MRSSTISSRFASKADIAVVRVSCSWFFWFCLVSSSPLSISILALVSSFLLMASFCVAASDLICAAMRAASLKARRLTAAFFLASRVGRDWMILSISSLTSNSSSSKAFLSLTSCLISTVFCVIRSCSTLTCCASPSASASASAPAPAPKERSTVAFSSCSALMRKAMACLCRLSSVISEPSKCSLLLVCSSCSCSRSSCCWTSSFSCCASKRSLRMLSRLSEMRFSWRS
mmetsp:Transcript_24596/g.43670  ORF Transcript_24596/g.43670 Transcript_24596/m.43670 type:complete len:230 (-) Transcript_24596:63-752(-)